MCSLNLEVLTGLEVNWDTKSVQLHAGNSLLHKDFLKAMQAIPKTEDRTAKFNSLVTWLFNRGPIVDAGKLKMKLLEVFSAVDEVSSARFLLETFPTFWSGSYELAAANGSLENLEFLIQERKLPITETILQEVIKQGPVEASLMVLTAPGCPQLNRVRDIVSFHLSFRPGSCELM